MYFKRPAMLLAISFVLVVTLMNASPQMVTNSVGDDSSSTTPEMMEPLDEYIPLTTPAPSGMVAYWEFNEGGGPYVHDSISPFITGQTYGSPTWPQGVAGTGMQLLTNQYVDFSNPPILNLPTTLTIEAWVNLPNTDGVHTIIVNSNSPTYKQYHFAISNGRLFFDRYYMSLGNEALSHLSISSNEWYHVAVSLNWPHNIVYFYINGVQDPFPNYQDTYSGPSAFVTAGIDRYASNKAYLNGMIDELAVYNEVVSQSIIQEHYEKGLLGLGYLDDFPANEPPVAADDSYGIDEDFSLSVPAPGVLGNDADVDEDPLTAVPETMPSHGSLSLSPDGSFIYNPNHNFNGIDTFTYRANDGELDSNVATVTITVDAVNDPPIAFDDTYSIAEDTVLNIPAPGVLANDDDVDEWDYVTVELDTSPEYGSLVLFLDGDFQYTPDPDFNGVDSFTYRIFDGYDYGNIATVTITVTSVNDAPVVRDDLFNIEEDSELQILVSILLANDYDADGDTLQFVLESYPAYGTLTKVSDTTYQYTPNPDWIGKDSFTYSVSDGSLTSKIAIVFIDVSAVNDPPIAVDDSYSITEDTTLNIPAPGVLANDDDVDEWDYITVELVTAPEHGSLILFLDGDFRYIPDPDFNGIDFFEYRIFDSYVYGNTATVTITVLPVNDPPVGRDDEFIMEEDTQLAIFVFDLLANDNDPDGDALQFVLASYPAYGVLTILSDTDLVYTPDPDWYGVTSFTYRVFDGADYSAEVTVTITVIDIIDDVTPPVTTITLSGQLGNNGWYISDVTITLTATDESMVSSTSYSYDGETWMEYDEPFILSRQGANIIYYYSVDEYGNVESINAYPINIDMTPPTTTITLETPPGDLGPRNDWYLGDVIITLTASDGESSIDFTVYSFNGVVWYEYTGPFTVTEEGLYTIYFHSVDIAGNRESPKSEDFKVDRTPPTIEFAFDGDLVITFTDAMSGISDYYYQISGTGWSDSGTFVASGERSIEIRISIPIDGSFEVSASATNWAIVDTWAEWDFWFDAFPPVTTISFDTQPGDLGPRNGWYLGSVTVTLTATDTASPIASTMYSLDGVTWIEYTAPFLITEEGITTIYYYSTDTAGFVESVKEADVQIDISLPIVDFGYDGDLVITLTDMQSGIASCSYSVRGPGWQYDGIYDGPVTNVVEIRIPIPVEGFIEVTALVWNDAWMDVWASWSFWIDDEPPMTSITFTGTLDDNSWYISDVEVTLTATDNFEVASTLYSLDGIDWVIYTEPFIISDDGLTTVYFYSIDAAGNTEPTNSDSIIIDTDTTGPIITITYTGDFTDANPGYWTVLVEDPESGVHAITIEIDGVLVGTLAGDYPVPNSLGVHTIRVNATNADLSVGPDDQESTTLSESVSIIDDDTTAPEITIVYTGDATASDPGVWTVTVTDPESGIASIIVEIDGVIVGDIAGDYAVPSSTGDHTIIVTAYNADLDRGDIDQDFSTASSSITITGELKAGFVTGGGWIIDEYGRKGHFAFVVHFKPPDEISGAFLYTFKDHRRQYVVLSTEWISLTIDDDHASFEVKCVIFEFKLRGCRLCCVNDDYIVRVDVWDNGHGRGVDIFQIRIEDPTGQIWYEAGFDPLGHVRGGAIVIHEYKAGHCHCKRWGH